MDDKKPIATRWVYVLQGVTDREEIDSWLPLLLEKPGRKHTE
jgi:hypothetical protein